ncbi:putative membrane protein [Silvibacterium bohemicum]|uniref:Putative membrane protein n=1 Tax=Silvibacterium bohemicum TaxID=1577686 RepID=A0A841JXS3_9BACT|nr:hypothetical protein [Silvibacterium bohemicum]MBB6146146.1 putative membrane protein [Silvibacterium bohemicum]
MFSHVVFWPWFTGIVFFFAGLFLVRRDVAAASGLDRLVVLGRVFTAASLALFAAEHITIAQFIVQGVPPWMPGRLFWVYFVSAALLATALSLLLMRYAGLSSALMAIMLFLFVLMLHIPRVCANPRDRFSWAVAIRDSAFGTGFLAFACTLPPASRIRRAQIVIAIARVFFASAILFFAVEHFLHPQFAPGVPLQKLTPMWVPWPTAWGYLVGGILIVAGAAMLTNRFARPAATGVGLVMALLTAFLYLPILAHIGPSSDIMEALNYIADTLLFSGTALLLAAALTRTPSPATTSDS